MNKRRVYSFSEIAPEADMISAEAYTLNFKICVQEYTPQAYLYTLFWEVPNAADIILAAMYTSFRRFSLWRI